MPSLIATRDARLLFAGQTASLFGDWALLLVLGIWAAASVALSVPQTASLALGAALSTVVDYRLLLVVMVVVTAASAAYLLTRRALVPAPAAA